MKKALIKVVKRNNKVGPEEKPVIAAARKKVENVERRNAVIVVSNWISERRENCLVEKAFSDSTILAWRTA